jgi:hypothetical protein
VKLTPRCSDARKCCLSSIPISAGVPGIGAAVEKLRPPSIVRSTAPSLSNAKPTVGETKLNAATGRQRGDALKIDANVPPAFVEISAPHPDSSPITSVASSITSRRLTGSSMPVSSTLQSAPPSLLRRSVPSSPIAYSNEPARTTPRATRPNGAGFCHAQPKDTRWAPAVAATTRVDATTYAITQNATRLHRLLIVFSSGRLSCPDRRQRHSEMYNC